jgi:hypothetical protein
MAIDEVYACTRAPQNSTALKRGVWASVTDRFDLNGEGVPDPEVGMRRIREIFPNGDVERNQRVMFQNIGEANRTVEIEDIEAAFRQGGEGASSTVIKTLCILTSIEDGFRIGDIAVRPDDIGFLYRLRAQALVSAKLASPRG